MAYVFFDAVGTLIYPSPPVSVVYSRIGQRGGATLEMPEIAHRFRVAFRREEQADRLAGYQTNEARERRRWQAIVAEVFHDQPDPAGPFAELWNHFACPDAWAVFADVAPCLAWLSRHGIDWGIASNYDSRLRAVIDGLPALAGCRQLAISSEIGWRKPAPAFYAALVAMAQIPPAKVVCVGDDEENDWLGATDAGLPAVFLNRHDAVTAQIGKPAPIISRLDELPSRLTEMELDS